MPKAIPSGDEIIAFRYAPFTNILLIKFNGWMLKLSESNHFLGNIYAFRCKACISEKIDKSSCATATHIKCLASIVCKRNSSFVLIDAVVSIEVLTVPKMGDLVVGFPGI